MVLGSGETTAAVVVPIVFVALGSFGVYKYFIETGPVFSFGYKLFGANPPPKSEVEGFVTPGFDSIKALFQKGFDDGDELGAQFTAYVDGSLVVDLHGGFTDRKYKTTFTHDHIQQVFSSSKFMTSSIIMHLVNTKRMNLSDPIVKYWPEFGEGGKSHVTVQMLLAHRAGVSFLDSDRAPTLEEAADLDILATKIAGQPHNFDGKEVTAYHAVTRGWFLNEIVRRVTGSSVREIVYNEITPLIHSLGYSGFQFHYGIAKLETGNSIKLCDLDGKSFVQTLFDILIPAPLLKMLGLFPLPTAVAKSYLIKGSVPNKAFLGSGYVACLLIHPITLLFQNIYKIENRPSFGGRDSTFPFAYNDPAVRKAETPSSNGYSNASSLASLAEVVRKSQSPNGLVSPETFHDALQTPYAVEKDQVLLMNTQFTRIGFGVIDKSFFIGGVDGLVDSDFEMYGWAGIGGTLVVFDLKYGISASYTMNFTHLQILGDQRGWRLVAELIRIVKKLRDEKSDSIIISS
ncbi:beta-lactamase/transpeptidase-like protein [Obelidium mucronatum]|nr:beta-lactamase/transpeptidase-like protein [Obelidium mucronatum]